MKHMPLSDENIGSICRYFGFEYNISIGAVFIKTNYSAWIVFYSDNKVTDIYHENYRKNLSLYNKKPKFVEGFHHQNKNIDNFYDAVRYIYYHEKNFLKPKE